VRIRCKKRRQEVVELPRIEQGLGKPSVSFVVSPVHEIPSAKLTGPAATAL
jgi:predicted glycosyltransferase